MKQKYSVRQELRDVWCGMKTYRFAGLLWAGIFFVSLKLFIYFVSIGNKIDSSFYSWMSIISILVAAAYLSVPNNKNKEETK